MKKIFSLLVACMVMASLGINTFAQESIGTGAAALTADSHSNEFSKYGELVNYEEIKNPDGSVIYERTYRKPQISTFDGHKSGTDTYTKEITHTAYAGVVLCTLRVTATFTWDNATKTVYVSDASGEIVKKDNAKYSKESTSTSGNGKKKASATFSCLRTVRQGFSQTYSVKISCDYNGKNS